MTTQLTAARALTWALFAGLAAAWATGTAAAENRSVVELFTSQGCSSCPPADALLEKLATEPGVVAVSLPVDYWDYLGWKDTYAKPAYTDRQRAYSASRGDREVYTPQAVINGRIHANGASRSEISSAIAATASGLDVPLVLKRTPDGVAVSVGAAASARDPRVGTIVVMPIIGHREVPIQRGENANRKVVYTNIARDLIALGTWSGAAVTLAIPGSAIEGADSVVVIVQTGAAGHPGPILAAQQLTLR